jgi:hypothetical protein
MKSELIFKYIILICISLLIVKCTSDDLCRPTDEGKVMGFCNQMYEDRK